MVATGQQDDQAELFLLRVVGDSMVNAAIADGDKVIVRQQSVAENGDRVAAMIDGEVALKTFKHSGGHVWLHRVTRCTHRYPETRRRSWAEWSRYCAASDPPFGGNATKFS